jgi:hypothetical protein
LFSLSLHASRQILGATNPAGTLVISAALEFEANVPMETRHLPNETMGMWRSAMSISAISGNSYSDYGSQSVFHQIEQEFQQLGSDLQSGNLTAAQADFVTLQQDLSQTSGSSSSQTNNSTSNPIEQAFSQLSQDLQAGNLTAAQQDYQTLQQDFQNQAAQWSQSAHGTQGAYGHHHHHHDGGSGSSSESSQISQLMSQLGQDLQSGDLTSAQQTFASLQSLFGQSNQTGEQQSSTASDPTAVSASTTSTISVNA